MTERATIRPQYHFRPSSKGLLAWDVRALVEMSGQLEPYLASLDSISELNEPYWHDAHTRMTSKEIADHARLIQEADLSYPIILCHEGRLMDGMHRVCKAYLCNLSHIKTVQFNQYIPPHYVGKAPDELPYE